MTEARLLIEKAHYEMGVFERTGAMTSRQLIQLAETQIAEIERLRTAGDQMLTAFAEGTNWTAEKRAAYEAMNAALAGDSHDQ